MFTNDSQGTFSSILIIDDEVRLASKLQAICQLESIDARICHDAEAAIAIMPGFRPDVVLLDLNLGSGNRSGMEALPEILRASPSSCVLMYTGYGDIAKAIEATHAGAWDMIQKGVYKPEQLIAILRKRYREKRERDDTAKELERLLELETTTETARQLASGLVHDAAHRVQEVSFQMIRIERLAANHNDVGLTIKEARASLGKLDDSLELLAQFSETPFAEIAPFLVQPVLCSAVAECQQRLLAMDKQVVAIEVLDLQHRVFVESNERMFKMALLALLQNACEAQELTGGKITVQLRIVDGQVVISIADRGIGIPVDNLTKIGARCFTTKGSAGNGLGVLFATAVARRSNGVFELQNNDPPPGATAMMRFPLIEPKRANQTGVKS